MAVRQIILDTETTGLDPNQGHRIIEIGCVEMVNRRLTNRHFHRYIKPQREIDVGAMNVHGITNEFLVNMPVFKEIVAELLDFVKGAELVIHNAPFDVGFLNHEFQLVGTEIGKVADYCSVLDTLTMARSLHPGQRNSLDALCKRYSIDNSHRERHGALLDAEILALVYLAMTGGQGNLFGETAATDSPSRSKQTALQSQPVTIKRGKLPIIALTAEEEIAHQTRMTAIEKSSGHKSLWSQLSVVDE